MPSDRATREFGSLWSATERKTDLALESSDPPKDGAQEFTIPDKDIEFSAAAQAAEKKKPTWREHHSRTLLLQMASVGLSVVLVVNSLGGDILGNDMLFGGPKSPVVSQPVEPAPQPEKVMEPYTVSVNSQAELDALALREDADRITIVRSENGCDFSDLSGLSKLTNLWSLDLNSPYVSDLSPLAGLTNLEVLRLGSCNVRDLSPLAGLTNLRWFGLWTWDDNIRDLSPLAGLTNLESLRLGGCDINDLSPLTGLTNLTNLEIMGIGTDDIRPLSVLTNLEWLLLASNNFSDLSPLENLINLKELRLFSNSPLSQEQIDALQTKLPNCEISY